MWPCLQHSLAKPMRRMSHYPVSMENAPCPWVPGFRAGEETADARLHLGHVPSEDWLSNGVFFLALNRHVSTLPSCWLWQRERERQGRGAATDSRCPLMQSNVATTGPLCLPADILLSVQLKGTFADVRRWCAGSWRFQHVGFQHWCLEVLGIFLSLFKCKH